MQYILIQLMKIAGFRFKDKCACVCECGCVCLHALCVFVCVYTFFIQSSIFDI